MTIRAVVIAAQNYAEVLGKFHKAASEHTEAKAVLESTTTNRQYYANEVTEAREALEKCEDEARKEGSLP